MNFQAESLRGLGHGLRREVFFLNLEDGYFGCQVNESTDILQLLELSKLCDSNVDCYQGTDEQRNRLKCTGKKIFPSQGERRGKIVVGPDSDRKRKDLTRSMTRSRYRYNLHCSFTSFCCSRRGLRQRSDPRVKPQAHSRRRGA